MAKFVMADRVLIEQSKNSIRVFINGAQIFGTSSTNVKYEKDRFGETLTISISNPVVTFIDLRE